MTWVDAEGREVVPPGSQEDWRDDPPLKGPFVALDLGIGTCVVDAEGREVVPPGRAHKFAKCLAEVMNENCERLTEAWRADVKREGCCDGRQDERKLSPADLAESVAGLKQGVPEGAAALS